MCSSDLVFLYLLEVRPSAAASSSWLIATILRRMRTRAPTCWSVGFGAIFLPMVSEPPWLTARQSYEQKNRPDAGTFDIPIQRAIFGQRVCPFRVFDIASASTGILRECRFLDNDLLFLDNDLVALV